MLPAPAGMVPKLRRRPGARRGAPRARGDGPARILGQSRMARCSPRPRGWSHSSGLTVMHVSVLPAPAGMVPPTGTSRSTSHRAPRARGDGPLYPWWTGPREMCSPRPRGWSLLTQLSEDTPLVLPAPAGMVPTPGPRECSHPGAPRARGDGPQVARGDRYRRLCSPRPRGWSIGRHVGAQPQLVLPAPAGMVPGHRGARPAGPRAPRARGDGPVQIGFDPTGDPCSPRPRGWSRRHGRRTTQAPVLPAPAGMVPRRYPHTRITAGAPRARGDGPGPDCTRHSHSSCSPRPRGWSRVIPERPQRVRVLPAPAGMVPTPEPFRRITRCAPRARGDGPSPPGRMPASSECSPRPRGWSPGELSLRDTQGVLPAPAGMVPVR